MKMYKNGKSFFKTLVCASSLLVISNTTTIAQNNTTLQDVQEIIAIVNDKVISLYDLEQRAKLIALASGEAELSSEDQQYIQQQAMQALIDDRLKIQEAAKYEQVMTDDDVIASYENYASQFQIDGDKLEEQLKSSGVEKETLLNQIRSSMAWQSVVGGLLEQQVNVTDDEVDNFIDKMERNKGKDQYKVSEIFILITDNTQREQTLRNANLLHEQLVNGISFAGMAQQFSQSSTAAVGGDLGWVMEDEIPSEVNEKVLSMRVGQISEPIETEDGLYIVQVTDRRKILTLSEDDIAVQLMHMFFNRENLTDDEYGVLNQKVYSSLNTGNNCEVLVDKARALSPDESGILGTFRIGELPEEIREEVLSLEKGSGSNLYREPEGYRTFILCDKNIPSIDLPEYDTVLEDLTKSRVQLIAKRHLRDLRRDAIVDYR